MAVSSTSSKLTYNGSGTTGPFPVTFPFPDRSHVFAALKADAETDAVLLGSGEWRLEVAGTAANVYTTEAVEVGQILVIYREVPLTQPTALQPTGPIPAKSLEKALDRLLMQIQQVQRHLDEAGGETLPGAGYNVASWADDAARSTTVPVAVGQLGVQVDSQTVWIAQDTVAGAWSQFRPRLTNKLVLGFTADLGNYSLDYVDYPQDKTSTLFAAWGVDAVLFGGGGNYSGPSHYDDDWLWLSGLIDDGKVYPALGDVDVDYAGWEDRHTSKFPYLPQDHGGRYYSVMLGGGLVEVFVIHSGFNSVRTVVEPDGNEVGSDQHVWFVAAIEASSARWKIVMFHMSPVSLSATAASVASELAWPEFAKADLILCGKTKLVEILRWSDTMLVNVSATYYHDVDSSGELNGTFGATDRAIWNADRDTLCAARIIATDKRLEVEAWTLDGALQHCRNVTDFRKDVTLDAASVTLTDASTSTQYRIIVDNGVIQLEEV